MSIRDQYTDEQWNELTEEEQEGILSNDEDGEEEEQEEQIDEAAAQAKAKADADADAQAAADKKATDDAAAAQAEADAAAKAKAEPEPEPEKPVVAPRPRGVLNDTLPEDYSQRVEANNTAQDELAQKYEDGDISFAEYNKGMRKLTEEAMDLREVKMRAEISEVSSTNSVQQHWDGLMGSFLTAHPEAISTPVRHNAFDHILREITAPVMAAGGMPGQAEIDKAYARLAEEFGIQAKQPDGDKGAQPPAAKKENKVPPTLGAVPAAAHTDVDDGKWAHLDRLAEQDPIKFEETLMKMSEAERNEYMQSA
jgi:hypothetical protein